MPGQEAVEEAVAAAWTTPLQELLDGHDNWMRRKRSLRDDHIRTKRVETT